MTIRVLYFASLKERMGRAEDHLDARTICDVQEVWRRATGTPIPGEPVLVAVNQQYAAFDTPVSDGDEVAFFPPVTGG